MARAVSLENSSVAFKDSGPSSICASFLQWSRRLFRKNLDSDDHFSPPFLFMGMKESYQIQKKQKNHNFTVNKSG